MSADAKAWQEDDGSWHIIHDGECEAFDAGTVRHHGTAYDLMELLQHIGAALETPSMRWEFRTYPGGKTGLVGYTT